MNFILKILSFPFSIIFWIIVSFRNFFYDHNIISVRELGSKVISVGNIISGGAGKTPFTEMITRYITGKEKFAAIIIKGYMRETDDMKVAELGFKNEEGKLTSENFSDEGMLLLENFRELEKGRGIIIACDDKSKGAKFADSKFNPDVIILDDGFQHHAIHRDLDVVIINNKKDYLIPVGKMREPRKSLRRADIIALNNKFEPYDFMPGRKNNPHIVCNYELEGFFNIKNEKLQNENINATAFCGIGDPDSFRELLTSNSIKISSFIVFRDHHFFTSKEIEELNETYKTSKSNCIITTQKDFVRLKYSRAVSGGKGDNIFRELLSNYPLYYAKIKMQISQNADRLFDKIDDLLK